MNNTIAYQFCRNGDEYTASINGVPITTTWVSTIKLLKQQVTTKQGGFIRDFYCKQRAVKRNTFYLWLREGKGPSPIDQRLLFELYHAAYQQRPVQIDQDTFRPHPTQHSLIAIINTRILMISQNNIDDLLADHARIEQRLAELPSHIANLKPYTMAYDLLMGLQQTLKDSLDRIKERIYVAADQVPRSCILPMISGTGITFID